MEKIKHAKVFYIGKVGYSELGMLITPRGSIQFFDSVSDPSSEENPEYVMHMTIKQEYIPHILAILKQNGYRAAQQSVQPTAFGAGALTNFAKFLLRLAGYREEIGGG